MDKTMGKSYKMSRVILAVIAFIIFNIMLFPAFINEPVEEAVVTILIVPIVFAIIVYGISYPSTVISKLLISIGNKIENKLIRILFYIIGLPIIIFILIGGIYSIIYFISDTTPPSSDIGTALSQGLMLTFFGVAGILFIIVPYIQTVIVLVLQHFVKTKIT